VLTLPPDARQALGARARASVLRSATVRAMQDATLEVYEAVLTRPAGEPQAASMLASS
jgi:hypothetical protein